ncbi:MAG: biopolymer transporter ExbD [Casimicrobiaceae bacterium]
MAFGNFERKGGTLPMAEINMIPLIDVMLVLLVIFIITAPLLTHSVKIDLPKATSAPNLTKPDHIAVSIDAAGTVFWNGESVQPAEMARRMQDAAARQPQPELHLRADRTTQYQAIADVMAAAASAGVQRIGFVSDPSIAR